MNSRRMVVLWSLDWPDRISSIKEQYHELDY
jgi:hypothetical protein